ncbi:MAG: methylenetetrahydrofolate reductase [Myxococcales bacterium]|jgi:methylenetetrahydrofolate reductase (NADPH)|nr:methylenetetrahydrofolate reductase [Myxococcales bacterium]
MRIADRLADPAPCFSFEFFPPKTELGRAHLDAALRDLESLSPGFISITCGASGSARAPSIDLAIELQTARQVEVMAHLTCQGQSRARLFEELTRLRSSGIENVFALRGDPTDGACADESSPRSARDFTRFIRERGFDFCLGGAAYPEVHPRALSRRADLDDLKRKVDAGVSFLITQLFFDNAHYFDFVERTQKAGITVPIVPGIFPITSFDQIERFTRLCGATLPGRLRLELERHQADSEAVLQLGVAHATLQCLDLMNQGVRHLHFFTLNKSPATRLLVMALNAFRAERPPST